MTVTPTPEDMAYVRDLIRVSLKTGAPGLAEPMREAIVRSIALKIEGKVIVPLLSDKKGLVAFAREIIDPVFDGMDVDGWSIQSLALTHGLLSKTAYDPARHGSSMDAEPGDEWYEFAGPLAAATPASRPLPFNMDRRAQAAVLADLPESVAQEAGEFYENAGAGQRKPLKKREAMAVAWASVLRPYLIGLRDHYDPQARPQEGPEP